MYGKAGGVRATAVEIEQIAAKGASASGPAVKTTLTADFQNGNQAIKGTQWMPWC